MIRRAPARTLGLTALAALAATCASAAPPPGGDDPAPGAEASARAEAASGAGRQLAIDNDLYTFEYSYPAAVDREPALKQLLDVDLITRKGQLFGDATEQRAFAQEKGYPYNPYGMWMAWDVVTELPDWLSLSASISTYLGGAHPNSGFRELLWDKRAQVRRSATDLFVSKEALSAALRPAFCRELNRQRAQKRDTPINPDSDDPFDECIDPVNSTVILGSSDKRTFNRIGILIAPYEAGPYVEGDYEVTLPVTQKILDVVRPEYREFFSLMR